MSVVEDAQGRLKLAPKSAEMTSVVLAPQIERRSFHWPNNIIKRTMDVLISSTLLCLLSPLFALIALLVVLDGGPIIYRHRRLGKNLHTFECLKFRSMMHGEILEEYLQYNPQAAAEWRRHHKLTIDPRITSVGKLLRATSLDELPQLINVLRGEMSLVGPRPITMAETNFYGHFLPYYASVRPGMTGLWQVSGRSEVDYAARVALDRCYASINNILMDLAILASTPRALLSRHGAR